MVATRRILPIVQRLNAATKPHIYGMIHVPALPGTPLSSLSINKICQKVREETKIYMDCDVDGIILENMHDLPYTMTVGSEIVACMTRVCQEAVQTLGDRRAKIACGVQILASANREALSVAHAAELDFIRAEGFVFSHVADEGLINACAGDLLRFRKNIGADNIAIFADIKKKHCSHAITADVSVSDTAEAAAFFLADGIIITGFATGKPALVSDLAAAKVSKDIPVFVGSGVDINNHKEFRAANAFIIGSYFKEHNQWSLNLEPRKIRNFIQLIRSRTAKKETNEL